MTSKPVPQIIDGKPWTYRRTYHIESASVNVSSLVITAPDEDSKNATPEAILAVRFHELLHVRHSRVIDVPETVNPDDVKWAEDGRIHTIANKLGQRHKLDALPIDDEPSLTYLCQDEDRHAERNSVEAAKIALAGHGVRRGDLARRTLQSLADLGCPAAKMALKRLDAAVAELEASPFDRQASVRAARALRADLPSDEDSGDNKSDEAGDDEAGDGQSESEPSQDKSDTKSDEQQESEQEQDKGDGESDGDQDEDTYKCDPQSGANLDDYDPEEEYDPEEYESDYEPDFSDLDLPTDKSVPNFEFRGVGDGGWVYPGPPTISKLDTAVSVGALRKTRPAFINGPTVLVPVRAFTDGRIFGRVRAGQGGTILIDWSGSTALTMDDLDQMLNALPAATVAIYSGARFTIVAKAGRRVSKQPFETCSNESDYPCLIWLSKMPGPRVWISDGGVTVQNDYRASGIECAKVRKLCKSARISRADTAAGKRHWTKAIPYLKIGQLPPSALPYC